MRRTLLVARREFVENLRTKTFWIGIFSLPVIFGLAIVVTKFLERSKDVRSYAVLDLSEDQWLSTAVERAAAQHELQGLARAAQSNDPAEQRRATEQLAERIRQLPPDHAVRQLIDALVKKFPEYFGTSADAVAALTESAREKQLPPDAQARIQAFVTPWVVAAAADPKKRGELQQLISGFALARYRQIPFAELGIDGSSPPDVARKQLNAAIDDGRLFAYFVVPHDPVASDAGAEYVSNNLTDNDLRNWFANLTTQVVRERRIAALDLTQEQARSLQLPFVYGEQKVSATGETEQVDKSEKASKFAPIAFVYLLWIAVFTAAQMLLTNTVEEKSNRLIEVLLSSVSPLELMSGKVLGIAATGLTIIGSWVITAYVGSQLVPDASQLAKLKLAEIIQDPLFLGSFVGYFLAGYLLFAAILVALGSVCNSLKEAQNLMQPVFLLLIVPLIAMVFVVQDPNGTVARILTYIPLYTPFLMMNRAGGPPPLWEYAATTALILVSLVIAFWAAAKIFRVGILMTGKPPRIREILRWLRAPIGQVAVRQAPPRAE